MGLNALLEKLHLGRRLERCPESAGKQFKGKLAKNAILDIILRMPVNARSLPLREESGKSGQSASAAHVCRATDCAEPPKRIGSQR